MSTEIGASLMNCNLLEIGKEIESLNNEVDLYHVDILDWHYVKNMCLSPQFIKVIRPLTDLPIEAHLYVDNIDLDLIDTCLASGANIITMPYDVIYRSINRYSSYIREHGSKLGVFLNPAEPIDVIRDLTHSIDNLLIMSVDPGFSGQTFLPQTLDRIASGKHLREKTNAHFKISVDGDCNRERFSSLISAGTDVLCLGRGLFSLNSNTTLAAREVRSTLNSLYMN